MHLHSSLTPLGAGSPVWSSKGSSRRGFSRRGFSLLEVAVVATVMAILLAIAIPTLLGHTDRSHDQTAQLNLDLAYNLSEEAVSFNQGDLPDDLLAALTAPEVSEPSVSFDVAPSTASDEVSVAQEAEITTEDVRADDANPPDPGDEQPAIAKFALLSDSGTCWVLVKPVGEAPRYGTITGDCLASAVDPDSVSAASWAELN